MITTDGWAADISMTFDSDRDDVDGRTTGVV
jgi:hypothetical protein